MGLKVVQVSKELREFLQAYLYWAVSGSITGENPHNFDKDCGLCSNTISYTSSISKITTCLQSLKLKRELVKLLAESALGIQFPFGRTEYIIESATGTHHLNQRRLDWIKARLCEQEQA